MLVLLNEVRLPGAHAPNCSVTDCDELFIERKLLSIGSTQHVCVKEEEWEVIYQGVIDEKRLHPRIAESEASILIEFTIKSTSFLRCNLDS